MFEPISQWLEQVGRSSKRLKYSSWQPNNQTNFIMKASSIFPPNALTCILKAFCGLRRCLGGGECLSGPEYDIHGSGYEIDAAMFLASGAIPTWRPRRRLACGTRKSPSCSTRPQDGEQGALVPIIITSSVNKGAFGGSVAVQSRQTTAFNLILPATCPRNPF